MSFILDEMSLCKEGDEKTWTTIWDTNIPKNYYLLINGDKKIMLSTVRSTWQQKMYEDRVAHRTEMENRKNI